MKPTKDVRRAGTRKLEIRKERIRELATPALDQVVGGGNGQAPRKATAYCGATI